MALYPEFVSGSYLTASPNAANERCVNLVPEIIGTKGPAQIVYNTSPGLTLLTSGGTGPCRARFSQGGRDFSILGTTLAELSGSTLTTRGTVSNDGNPASISSNGAGGNQLLIVSGTNGYVFDLTANTLTAAIAQPGFRPSRMGAFMDGYFFALWSDGGGFSFSGLEDGTLWDGLDVAESTAASDPRTALAAINHLLWLFGEETSEVWYNTGQADNPFAPIPESLMQQGALSYTVAELDNTVFWVSQNRAGEGICWRAEGYRPVRISTHGVETRWQSYTTLADAIAWTYQLNGHAYYVLTFPIAGHTWAYDVSTNLWHERSYLNPTTANEEAALPLFHGFTSNQHIVGSRRDGSLYVLDDAVYNDAGDPIRRLRQAPILTNEKRYTTFASFQLDLESGLGLATGQGSDPQIMLQISKDRGHTWGNERWVSAGAMGHYTQRAIWRRFGRSRDWQFRVAMSDPIPGRWIAAYLQ
jgi:hypothetical protein